jgi:hypothetical protein
MEEWREYWRLCCVELFEHNRVLHPQERLHRGIEDDDYMPF